MLVFARLDMTHYATRLAATLVMLMAVCSSGAVASSELVSQGIDQARGGKSREAVRTLTDALETPELPSALAARAYYGRGLAYEKSQRPAQAIADFTAALWLGGLPSDEAADAAARRLAAFGASGVSPSPLSGNAPRAVGAAGARTAPVAARAAPLTMARLPVRKTKEPIRYVPPIRTAAVASAQPAQTRGGGASWYSGLTSLFGGNDAPSTTARQPATTPAQSGPARRDAPAAVSAFGRDGSPFGNSFITGELSPARATARRTASPRRAARTAVQAVDQAATPSPPAAVTNAARQSSAAAARATVATARAPAAQVATSDYNLQVATLKAQSRAQSYAAEIMMKHADIIGSAQADVDQTLVAGQGTRYRVRLGPFPSRQASLNACKQLKGVGVDCFLIR